MPPSVECVRDFVMQVERTLAARRLYHTGNAAFRDAAEKLLEKCRTAADSESFTLTIAASDLFFEKASVLHRPKLEESFFFPLYRDGLRELTFSADVSGDDLNKFLGVIELKEKDVGPGDDVVNRLWRCDLATITHNAVDGIGDIEGDAEEGGNELHALIQELAAKITDPAPPSTGQSYAFIVDADVRVDAQDFKYDKTSVRRRFEENPAVLRLSEAEAASIRSELGEDRDQSLVERFIEILLIIARSPNRSVDPAMIAPVFHQVAEGYWNARDYPRVAAILTHVRAAAADAPNPEYRAKLADVIRRFVTPERLNILILDFIGGALDPKIAIRFWDFCTDDVIWPILLDTWGRLPDGDTRGIVLGALRRRLASNMDLLRQALAAPEPARIRAALALLDERTERLFATDLVRLASHADEWLRLKGLAAATRVGGPTALEVLWKAVESDPSKSVRLYAFRAMSGSEWSGLSSRLQALVTDEHFAERPAWEREKYVRLLASIAGPAVEALFESWIPAKRWLWQAKDLEQLDLALRGLGATGDSGFEKVQAIANGGGRPGEVARKVIESLSRAEIGDSTMMKQAPIAAKGGPKS